MVVSSKKWGTWNNCGPTLGLLFDPPHLFQELQSNLRLWSVWEMEGSFWSSSCGFHLLVKIEGFVFFLGGSFRLLVCREIICDAFLRWWVFMSFVMLDCLTMDAFWSQKHEIPQQQPRFYQGDLCQNDSFELPERCGSRFWNTPTFDKGLNRLDHKFAKVFSSRPSFD